MKKKISFDDTIFVAGGRGMVGSAICRMLKKLGYGNNEKGGQILSPTREELDLLDITALRDWFFNKKPNVVIIAAAKVGRIIGNSTVPADVII